MTNLYPITVLGQPSSAGSVITPLSGPPSPIQAFQTSININKTPEQILQEELKKYEKAGTAISAFPEAIATASKPSPTASAF